MNLRDFVDVKSRRNALEKNLGLQLANIGSFSLDEELAARKNCENMIGAVQVPLGIAGPLKINHQSQKTNNYFIPLATTEGALVASINRGCKAVSQSGGAKVISEKIGITRAPVFFVKDITHGQKFIKWIDENFTKIKEITESTSSHLTLSKIIPQALGRNIWLKFLFDTGEAMGMNMATIAVAAAMPFIENGSGAKCIALSGNLCVDKKPSFLNLIEGRGCKIWSDVFIDEEIISTVLKTSSDKIIETSQRKLLYGSIMSGSIGANAHHANILSAIFLATGQDIAHISESSIGTTTVEKTKNGLYASIYLPDLVIGTIGGGTQLDTQKEALNIMGLDPQKEKGTVQKFAEIIGGAVLAGELSLLASLAEGSLAKAHEKYGRGK